MYKWHNNFHVIFTKFVFQWPRSLEKLYNFVFYIVQARIAVFHVKFQTPPLLFDDTKFLPARWPLKVN